MPDDEKQPKPKLPSFWYAWLLLFLLFLPLLVWVYTMAPTFSLTKPSRHPFVDAAMFSLYFALVIYLANHFSKPGEKNRQKQEQARIRTLKNPFKITAWEASGLICAFVGSVSCIAHLITGCPSIPQVIGFTLGMPLYYYIAFHLLTKLEKRLDARDVRRKTSASNTTSPLAAPTIELAAETTPAHWQATEPKNQTVGR